ncbi:MAG: transcription antitermination factor NusB [Dehalococcoidia bacterium]|nr:MAG: transcription antitermination factor NusB [Dehalococcoidia bacterium]
MGIRRKARTIALQTLFEVDCVAHDAGETLDRLLEEASLPEEGALFARELVGGVLKNRERIDTMIQSYAPAWPVAQLAAIDRNILRLAIFEILLNNKVPVKAAINEAVELAKTFGSENSPKFINGVLGTVSAQASR